MATKQPWDGMNEWIKHINIDSNDPKDFLQSNLKIKTSQRQAHN